MKLEKLKSIIKECVREVFQDEIKNILIESIKSNKQPIVENGLNFSTQPIKEDVSPNYGDIRAKYNSILNEEMRKENMKLNGHVPEYKPIPGMDLISEGTQLPEGDVPLDMINSIVSKTR